MENSSNAPTVTPELLTLKQVAVMLQVSTRTVLRRSADGSMPRPVSLGANTRWLRSEIQAWCADGCPAVSAEKGTANG